MALEPITRKEKIIAGENLEPITRLEKFLKEYGGSGGGGGGADDVYVIKYVENYDTQAVELHGDYAGAVAALDSGKSLKFVSTVQIGGKEKVFYESFSYYNAMEDSEIKFVCYSGYNFMTFILTESGINNLGEDTHVNSLYVDAPGNLFLRSPAGGTTTPSKLFRVIVSDRGELSTKEVT